MGVYGRRWKLPDGDEETRAREKLLAALGVPESAIVDVPEAEVRENVLAEFFKAERAWLVELAAKGGLTKNPSPTRAVRLLVRAVIANRDLLPFTTRISPEPPWLDLVPPREARLRAWLDSLPDAVLADLLIAVRAAVTRRK